MPLKENPDRWNSNPANSSLNNSIKNTSNQYNNQDRNDYNNYSEQSQNQDSSQYSDNGYPDENDSNYSDENYSEDDVAENDKTNILYDPNRAKKFLIYIAKAVKRYDLRKNAHKDFHDHLEKIKTIKPKSKSLDDDIEELKRKVAYLINVEKKAIPLDNDKYTHEKIQLLESKLNRLLESRRIREERFKELERKISTRMVSEGKEIDNLKTKLLLMEKSLLEMQLKTKSKVKTQELKNLKKKINDTKAILEQY